MAYTEVIKFEQEGLEKINQELQNTQTNMQQVSDTAQTGYRNVDTMIRDAATAIMSQAASAQKLVQLMDHEISDMEKYKERDKIRDQARASTATNDARAMRDVAAGKKTADGDYYSLNEAATRFRGFSDAAKAGFNMLIPNLTSLIMKGITEQISGTQSKTIPQISNVIRGMQRTNAFTNLFKQEGINDESVQKEIVSLTQGMAPYLAGIINTRTFAETRYGLKNIPRTAKATIEQLIPNSLMQSYKESLAKGTAQYVPSAIFQNRRSAGFTHLNQRAMDEILRPLFERNEEAVAAADIAGLLRKNEFGRYVFGDTSIDAVQKFERALWERAQTKISGGVSKAHMFSGDARQEAIVASRMAGSNAGSRNIAAAQILSDMFDREAGVAIVNGQFVDTETGKRITGKTERHYPTNNSKFFSAQPVVDNRIIQESARRASEQYVVSKISMASLPGGSKEGKGIAPYKVAIEESSGTRLLGLSGHDNEETDKILIMAVDENEETAKKVFNQLNKTGFRHTNGKMYDVQGFHGTGRDTEIRLIERAARAEANRPFEAIMQRYGLRGDVFSGFMDSKLITNPHAYGRYWDASNKLFSGSVDIGIGEGAMKGKKIAIIDSEAMAARNPDRNIGTLGNSNGIGYLLGDFAPMQARMGTSSKGMMYPIHMRTMTDFARANGLITGVDANGNPVAEVIGASSDEYKQQLAALRKQLQEAERDSTKIQEAAALRQQIQAKEKALTYNLLERDEAGNEIYGGYLTQDFVKNMPSLGQARSAKPLVGREANMMFSDVMAYLPPVMMHNAEAMDTTSGKIGGQMARFMDMTPEFQKVLIGNFEKRMAKLNTPQGIRDLIFADENDAFAQGVVSGEIPLNAPEVQRRTNAYKQKALQDLMSGVLWDESGKDVQNKYLQASPMAGLYAMGYRPDYDRVYKALKSAAVENGPYTRKELADMFVQFGGRKGFIDQLFTLDKKGPNGEAYVVDAGSSEENIAGVRTPTGAGVGLKMRNIARFAIPAYEAVGGHVDNASVIIPSWGHAFESGSDLDGDKLKMMYNEFAQQVSRSIDAQQKAMEQYGITPDDPRVKPRVKEMDPSAFASHQANQTTPGEALAANMHATLGMGSFSGASTRGTMRQWTMENIVGMFAGQNAYDVATTPKNMNYVDMQSMPQAYWDNLAYGREFTHYGMAAQRILSIPTRGNMEKEEYRQLLGRQGLTENDVQEIDGIAINLKALREADLDNVNWASAYNSTDLSVLARASAARRHPQLGSVLEDLKVIREAQDRFIGLPEWATDPKSATAQYVKLNRDVLSAQMTGNLTAVDQYAKQIDNLGPQAMDEAKAYFGQTYLEYREGRLKLDDMTQTQRDYIDAVMQGGSDAGKKFIAHEYGRFGITHHGNALEFGTTQANTSADIYKQLQEFQGNPRIAVEETATENIRPTEFNLRQGAVQPKITEKTETPKQEKTETEQPTETKAQPQDARSIAQELINQEIQNRIISNRGKMHIRGMGATSSEAWIPAPVSLAGLKSINLNTGEEVAIDNPYAKFYNKQSDRQKIMDDFVTDRFEATEATSLGRIMHAVFQNAHANNLTPSAAKEQLRNMLLGQGDFSANKDVQNLLANYKIEENEGRFTVAPINEGTIKDANSLSAKINALYGTATTEGHLEKYLTSLRSQGDIVNIEGRETELNAQGVSANAADTGGNGIKKTFTIEGDPKVFTTQFATDGILKFADKDAFKIFDYKSSQGGALQAIVQMGSYAHDIEQKAVEAYQHPEKTELAAYKKYINYDEKTGEYTSKITELEGWDPLTNTAHRYGYNREVGDRMSRIIEQAKADKYNDDATLQQAIAKQLWEDDALNPIMREAGYAKIGERIVQQGQVGQQQQTEQPAVGQTQGVNTGSLTSAMVDAQAAAKLQERFADDMKAMEDFSRPKASRNGLGKSLGYINAMFTDVEKTYDEMKKTGAWDTYSPDQKGAMLQQLDIDRYARRQEDVFSLMSADKQAAFKLTDSNLMKLDGLTPEQIDQRRNAIQAQLNGYQELFNTLSDSKFLKENATDEDKAKRDAIIKFARDQMASLQISNQDFQEAEQKAFQDYTKRRGMRADQLLGTGNFAGVGGRAYAQAFNRSETIKKDIADYQKQIDELTLDKDSKITVKDENGKTVERDKYTEQEKTARQALIDNLTRQQQREQAYLDSGVIDRDAATQAGYAQQNYENALAMHRQAMHRSHYGGGYSFGGRIAAMKQGAMSGYQSEINNITRQGGLMDQAKAEYNKYYGQDGKLLPGADPKAAEAASKNLNKLTGDLNKLQAGFNSASGVGGTFKATLATIGQSISTMFGRRLMMNAINEVKNFIKQFDQQMTQIQMITMKSDEEMKGVQSRTIKTALELKTSVANVAGTEAALYRQGLDDSQVESRLTSIIKFAQVAGIKTEEATKIITTALNNNLVGSAEEAMDALTALGDSAATTAAEISKALQKSAATATVAGVSYEELVSMITLVESKTQLSGSQVGTAFNTIFSRMKSMSVKQYVEDESGQVTNATDVSKALALAGVSMEDENGNWRDTTDILLDLSKVWNGLNEKVQSVITKSIAGTRMTNIFSTLMSGLAEDDGELFQKYLDTAANSAGITADKYEVYAESLNASLTMIRTSFDNFINATGASGAGQAVFNVISGLFNGLATLSENSGGIAAGIGLILGTLLAGLVSVKAVALGPVGTLIGLLAGIGMFAGVTAFGGLFKGSKESEYDKQLKAQKELNAKVRDNTLTAAKTTITIVTNAETALSDIQGLKDKLKELEQEGKILATGNQLDIASVLKLPELQPFIQDLKTLETVFPGVTGALMKAALETGNWDEAIEKIEKRLEQLRKDAAELGVTSNMATFKDVFDETITDTRKNAEHYTALQVLAGTYNASDSQYHPENLVTGLQDLALDMWSPSSLANLPELKFETLDYQQQAEGSLEEFLDYMGVTEKDVNAPFFKYLYVANKLGIKGRTLQQIFDEAKADKDGKYIDLNDGTRIRLQDPSQMQLYDIWDSNEGWSPNVGYIGTNGVSKQARAILSLNTFLSQDNAQFRGVTNLTGEQMIYALAGAKGYGFANTAVQKYLYDDFLQYYTGVGYNDFTKLYDTLVTSEYSSPNSSDQFLYIMKRDGLEAALRDVASNQGNYGHSDARTALLNALWAQYSSLVLRDDLKAFSQYGYTGFQEQLVDSALTSLMDHMDFTAFGIPATLNKTMRDAAIEKMRVKLHDAGYGTDEQILDLLLNTPNAYNIVNGYMMEILQDAGSYYVKNKTLSGWADTRKVQLINEDTGKVEAVFDDEESAKTALQSKNGNYYLAGSDGRRIDGLEVQTQTAELAMDTTTAQLRKARRNLNETILSNGDLGNAKSEQYELISSDTSAPWMMALMAQYFANQENPGTYPFMNQQTLRAFANKNVFTNGAINNSVGKYLFDAVNQDNAGSILEDPRWIPIISAVDELYEGAVATDYLRALQSKDKKAIQANTTAYRYAMLARYIKENTDNLSSNREITHTTATNIADVLKGGLDVNSVMAQALYTYSLGPNEDAAAYWQAVATLTGVDKDIVANNSAYEEIINAAYAIVKGGFSNARMNMNVPDYSKQFGRELDLAGMERRSRANNGMLTLIDVLEGRQWGKKDTTLRDALNAAFPGESNGFLTSNPVIAAMLEDLERSSSDRLLSGLTEDMLLDYAKSQAYGSNIMKADAWLKMLGFTGNEFDKRSAKAFFEAYQGLLTPGAGDLLDAARSAMTTIFPEFDTYIRDYAQNGIITDEMYKAMNTALRTSRLNEATRYMSSEERSKIESRMRTMTSDNALMAQTELFSEMTDLNNLLVAFNKEAKNRTPEEEQLLGSLSDQTPGYNADAAQKAIAARQKTLLEGIEAELTGVYGWQYTGTNAVGKRELALQYYGAPIANMLQFSDQPGGLQFINSFGTSAFIPESMDNVMMKYIQQHNGTYTNYDAGMRLAQAYGAYTERGADQQDLEFATWYDTYAEDRNLPKNLPDAYKSIISNKTLIDAEKQRLIMLQAVGATTFTSSDYDMFVDRLNARVTDGASFLTNLSLFDDIYSEYQDIPMFETLLNSMGFNLADAGMDDAARLRTINQHLLVTRFNELSAGNIAARNYLTPENNMIAVTDLFAQLDAANTLLAKESWTATDYSNIADILGLKKEAVQNMSAKQVQGLLTQKIEAVNNAMLYHLSALAELSGTTVDMLTVQSFRDFEGILGYQYDELIGILFENADDVNSTIGAETISALQEGKFVGRGVTANISATNLRSVWNEMTPEEKTRAYTNATSELFSGFTGKPINWNDFKNDVFFGSYDYDGINATEYWAWLEEQEFIKNIVDNGLFGYGSNWNQRFAYGTDIDAMMRDYRFATGQTPTLSGADIQRWYMLLQQYTGSETIMQEGYEQVRDLFNDDFANKIFGAVFGTDVAGYISGGPTGKYQGETWRDFVRQGRISTRTNAREYKDLISEISIDSMISALSDPKSNLFTNRFMTLNNVGAILAELDSGIKYNDLDPYKQNILTSYVSQEGLTQAQWLNEIRRQHGLDVTDFNADITEIARRHGWEGITDPRLLAVLFAQEYGTDNDLTRMLNTFDLSQIGSAGIYNLESALDAQERVQAETGKAASAENILRTLGAGYQPGSRWLNAAVRNLQERAPGDYDQFWNSDAGMIIAYLQQLETAGRVVDNSIINEMLTGRYTMNGSAIPMFRMLTRRNFTGTAADFELLRNSINGIENQSTRNALLSMFSGFNGFEAYANSAGAPEDLYSMMQGYLTGSIETDTTASKAGRDIMREYATQENATSRINTLTSALASRDYGTLYELMYGFAPTTIPADETAVDELITQLTAREYEYLGRMVYRGTGKEFTNASLKEYLTNVLQFTPEAADKLIGNYFNANGTYKYGQIDSTYMAREKAAAGRNINVNNMVLKYLRQNNGQKTFEGMSAFLTENGVNNKAFEDYMEQYGPGLDFWTLAGMTVQGRAMSGDQLANLYTDMINGNGAIGDFEAVLSLLLGDDFMSNLYMRNDMDLTGVYGIPGIKGEKANALVSIADIFGLGTEMQNFLTGQKGSSRALRSGIIAKRSENMFTDQKTMQLFDEYRSAISGGASTDFIERLKDIADYERIIRSYGPYTIPSDEDSRIGEIATLLYGGKTEKLRQDWNQYGGQYILSQLSSERERTQRAFTAAATVSGAAPVNWSTMSTEAKKNYLIQAGVPANEAVTMAEKISYENGVFQMSPTQTWEEQYRTALSSEFQEGKQAYVDATHKARMDEIVMTAIGNTTELSFEGVMNYIKQNYGDNTAGMALAYFDNHADERAIVANLGQTIGNTTYNRGQVARDYQRQIYGTADIQPDDITYYREAVFGQGKAVDIANTDWVTLNQLANIPGFKTGFDAAFGDGSLDQLISYALANLLDIDVGDTYLPTMRAIENGETIMSSKQRAAAYFGGNEEMLSKVYDFIEGFYSGDTTKQFGMMQTLTGNLMSAQNINYAIAEAQAGRMTSTVKQTLMSASHIEDEQTFDAMWKSNKEDVIREAKNTVEGLNRMLAFLVSELTDISLDDALNMDSSILVDKLRETGGEIGNMLADWIESLIPNSINADTQTVSAALDGVAETFLEGYAQLGQAGHEQAAYSMARQAAEMTYAETGGVFDETKFAENVDRLRMSPAEIEAEAVRQLNAEMGGEEEYLAGKQSEINRLVENEMAAREAAGEITTEEDAAAYREKATQDVLRQRFTPEQIAARTQELIDAGYGTYSYIQQADVTSAAQNQNFLWAMNLAGKSYNGFNWTGEQAASLSGSMQYGLDYTGDQLSWIYQSMGLSPEGKINEENFNAVMAMVGLSQNGGDSPEAVAALQFMNLLGPEYSEILTDIYHNYKVLGAQAPETAQAMTTFNRSITGKNLDAMVKYGDYATEVKEDLEGLLGRGDKASAVVNKLTSTMAKLNKARYSFNKGKNGAELTKEEVEAIAEGTGKSVDEIADEIEGKDNMYKLKESMTNLLSESLDSSTAAFGGELEGVFDFVWDNLVDEASKQKLILGDGSVDLSAMASSLDSEYAGIAALLMSMCGTMKVTQEGDGFKIEWIGGGTAPTGGGGGGGGGGGKSKIDEFIEKLKRLKSEFDHLMKMKDYQGSYYKNRGELTMYNKVLQDQIILMRERKEAILKEIADVKKQMKTTENATDDYNKLVDALYDLQEEYGDLTVKIDETTREIKENERQINKLIADLKDKVRDMYDQLMEKEKEKLGAYVDLESQIMEIIRQQYQDEWDLIKEDIERKRQALEEEKQFIQERLDARREAEDEAQKYQQLAELRTQLAMIETDSTRTKDAAGLRKQIADIEREQGMKIAEDEAQSQMDMLDDEIEAYDDFETAGDDYMEELLADAATFITQVNEIMQMGQASFINWLKANDQAYQLASEHAQQQMLDNWKETWDTMAGITYRYWDEIQKIIQDRDTLEKWLTDNLEKLDYSLEGRLEQIADFLDMWDAMHSSTLTFDYDTYDYIEEGVGVVGAGQTFKYSDKDYSEDKVTNETFETLGKDIAKGITEGLKSIAMSASAAKQLISNPGTADEDMYNALAMYQFLSNQNASLFGFASGGIANFTGPALLDGTPQKPERILSPHQTELFEEMVASLERGDNVAVGNYLDTAAAMGMAKMPNISADVSNALNGGSGFKVDNVNITLNEARLEEDADYEEVANKVGDAFVKELSRQGMHVMSYSF